MQGRALPTDRCSQPQPARPPPPPESSHEEWWEDEVSGGAATAVPLGHNHVEGCWPYNQVLPRLANLAVDTLQHVNPAELTQLRVKLMRPDGNEAAMTVVPAPECAEAGETSILTCKKNLRRMSLTPRM